jgi:lysylphosphatidylglycerol synthetase-like protein (DUF2156 family)
MPTNDAGYLTFDEVMGLRIEGIIEKQRRKGYTLEHDRHHVQNEPHVCIGLVAQYMGAGRWDDAAAMALSFAYAARALAPSEPVGGLQ